MSRDFDSDSDDPVMGEDAYAGGYDTGMTPEGGEIEDMESMFLEEEAPATRLARDDTVVPTANTTTRAAVKFMDDESTGETMYGSNSNTYTTDDDPNCGSGAKCCENKSAEEGCCSDKTPSSCETSSSTTNPSCCGDSSKSSSGCCSSSPTPASVPEQQLSSLPGVGKVHVQTWGCSHNTSDAEVMAGTH
jgi:hypothetical protein